MDCEYDNHVKDPWRWWVINGKRGEASAEVWNVMHDCKITYNVCGTTCSSKFSFLLAKLEAQKKERNVGHEKWRAWKWIYSYAICGNIFFMETILEDKEEIPNTCSAIPVMQLFDPGWSPSNPAFSNISNSEVLFSCLSFASNVNG